MDIILIEFYFIHMDIILIGYCRKRLFETNINLFSPYMALIHSYAFNVDSKTGLISF